MKSINEISFNGKKVFIRVDFNVPFNDYGEITDSSRIAASLPPIEYVLSNGGNFRFIHFNITAMSNLLLNAEGSV